MQGDSLLLKRLPDEGLENSQAFVLTFAAFDNSTRPSEEHFRALRFPVDGNKPEVIWVHCPWYGGEGFEDGNAVGKGYQHPDPDGLVGHNTVARDTPITYNDVRKRDMEDAVVIVSRDAFRFDGSKPNLSIAKIQHSAIGRQTYWRGPVVAYAVVGKETYHETFCKDFDIDQFRDVVDFFHTYPKYSPPFSELFSGLAV